MSIQTQTANTDLQVKNQPPNTTNASNFFETNTTNPSVFTNKVNLDTNTTNPSVDTENIGSKSPSGNSVFSIAGNDTSAKSDNWFDNVSDTIKTDSKNSLLDNANKFFESLLHNKTTETVDDSEEELSPADKALIKQDQQALNTAENGMNQADAIAAAADALLLNNGPLIAV